MKKILVVDDNEANLTMIQGILRGSYRVYPVTSGTDALRFMRSQKPDLVLLDIQMPGMTGIELIKIMKAEKKLSDIPVIFLTVMSDAQSEATAFKLGAVDYIHKPVNSTVALARVKLHLELEAYRKELQALVDKKTSQILLMQKVTIELLADISEFRDKNTGNHVKRTVGYVTAIMDNLPSGLPDSYHISKDYYDSIKKSTPLHDIGKISIPDSILLKPGPLTPEEFNIIKTHVLGGADLLKRVIHEFDGPSFLDVALEMILTHHEKWNGTGYPNNLAGEDIPISGRIMALADVYDALTSKRPYKEAFAHERAFSIITDGCGTHFDPVLVETFLRIRETIIDIDNRYKSHDASVLNFKSC